MQLQKVACSIQFQNVVQFQKFISSAKKNMHFLLSYQFSDESF